MSDKIKIEKCRFFYLRKHINEEGLVLRCEAFDNDTDHCYSVTQYFYNEQKRLIKEAIDVDNEQERSHTEATWTYPDDWWIRESIKHYEYSAQGHRDERCIERYKDSIVIRDTYDLETGNLIDHETCSGEEELKENYNQ